MKETRWWKFALVALCGSLLAHADNDVARRSRGDLFKAHQYESFGTFSLFVDPTGNDGNACTSSGVNACLTIQGAVKKLPKQLRHQATISVAAGTYAGITISGFMFDQTLQGTAGILIDGALANVTPTTGSATGTATAGTAGSGATFGTLTDGAATWTVNDAALVGKFVVITGGTGSGQVRVIVSNTATVLTIAGAWTAPTGTSTYALQSPSVNITTAAPAVTNPLGTSVVAAGIQVFDNISSVGRVTFRNINVAITGGATTGASVIGSAVTDFVQTTFVSTSGQGINSNTIAGSVLNISQSAVTSTSGAGVAVSGTAVSTNVLLSQTTGTSVLATNGSQITLSNTQLKGLSGLLVQTNSTASVSNTRCDCASQANSSCLAAGVTPAVAVATGPNRINSVLLSGAVDVTNCSYGLFATGVANITGGTNVVSGNALTNAADARWGASILMTTSTQTITGATAEMSLDNGAATGTWASLAASFDCLTNLATGSKVCRL